MNTVTVSLLVAAGLAAVFALVVSSRPSEFRVTRSTAIAAPPAAVFGQVNDLHRWEAWSPWAKIDPAMKQTYDGPAAGVGAAYEWAGNRNVGEGRMRITESLPPELIRFKLEFLKPFKGDCDTLFTFQPQGGGTQVTWTMSGRNHFLAKAMGLFMDCDKMVGGQFETGLTNLKSLVEAGSGK
jgi:hypothetical protein